MSRKMKLKSYQFWISALLAMLGLLSACYSNARDGRRPVLHTTISADGQMIAALLHAGTEQQVLRVRMLTGGGTWRTVQAPPFTQDLRFGMQGHELLVSHYQANSKTNVLAKLDLDNPLAQWRKLYEGADLGFPVEVSPGRVMVRTHHPPNPSTRKVNAYSYYWILVEEGQSPVRVGPERMLGSTAPSIVGSGFFFWFNDFDGKANKVVHPKIRSFPLPGGLAPTIDGHRIHENAWKLVCDHSGKRCLESFIANYKQVPAAPFVYDIHVLLGSERCKPLGIAGWHDDVSITPDGKAAIMSLASGADKPRQVVVMHFNARQCQAISVRHINFEEK